MDTAEADDFQLAEHINSVTISDSKTLVEGVQVRQILLKTLDTLTPREAQILRLRFGLDHEPELTLEAIGQRFGVTRERIRQIEAKAIRKMKHPSRKKNLKGLLDVKETNANGNSN